MEKLKRALKGAKWELFAAAAALILLGVLFIIYPGSSVLAICYVIAGFLCVWGILRVVLYFVADRVVSFGSFGLVQGATLIVLSILIFAKPAFLAGILTTVFGIVMIIDGVLKLQFSIDLLRLKAAYWWLVGAGAVLMALLGVIAVLNPFATSAALMVYLGVSLVADGIADIVSLLYVNLVIRKVKRVADEAAEDVKAEVNAVEADFHEEAAPAGDGENPEQTL